MLRNNPCSCLSVFLGFLKKLINYVKLIFPKAHDNKTFNNLSGTLKIKLKYKLKYMRRNLLEANA